MNVLLCQMLQEFRLLTLKKKVVELYSLKKKPYLTIWMKALTWYVRSLFKFPFCNFSLHWVILNVEWSLLSFPYLNTRNFSKWKFYWSWAATPHVSADNSGPEPAVVPWLQSKISSENKYIKPPSFPYYGLHIHNREETSGCMIWNMQKAKVLILIVCFPS